jgi:tetratricopeptide (TPR) repeat protein
MFYLGNMLDDRGNLKGAEAAYEHADRLGSADAAINLGLVLECRGAIVDALVAYWRAEERGHPDAALYLGTCSRNAAISTVRRLPTSARTSRETQAAFQLGNMHVRSGDLDAALAESLPIE